MGLRDRPRAVPSTALRQRVEAEWRGDAGRRPAAAARRLVLVVATAIIAIVGLAAVGAGVRLPDTTIQATIVPTPAAVVPPPLPKVGVIRTFTVRAGSAAHSHQCHIVVESDCATAIASGGGSIWTTTSDGVARIDPSTGGVIATIPVGAFPHRLAFTGGSLWVTTEKPGRLIRIDPAKNTVAATVEVGGMPAGLVVTAGAVWVADVSGERLVRVDLASLKVAGSIDLGDSPWGIATLDGSIWVSNKDGVTLWRVDPAKERVVDTIDIRGTESPDHFTQADVFTIGGRIWVTGHQSLKIVDPGTGSVTERLAPSESAMAVGPDAVWVSSPWTSTLQRLDPVTLEIVAQQRLTIADPNWEPSLVVGDDGAIWIRTYDEDKLFRIVPTPKP
jgi:sugar lactone lactonase YvrE